MLLLKTTRTPIVTPRFNHLKRFKGELDPILQRWGAVEYKREVTGDTCCIISHF